MTPLVTPTTDPNATSKEALLRQGFDIMSALDTAIYAYRQAMPNGRDYLALVTRNIDQITVADARKAWSERIEKLSMHREMAFWIRNVDHQGRVVCCKDLDNADLEEAR